MNKQILVPLADGFEEIEFTSIVDVLRRAGLEVLIGGLNGARLYKGAHGIEIAAPKAVDEIAVDSLEGIVLAGGFQGMLNLKNSPKILQIIQTLHASKKLVSAICASPIVLNEADVLSGAFTCYPGCEKEFKNFDNQTTQRLNQAVVISKNIITSAGPGTAILFGLEIVKYLLGESTYKQLYDELLVSLAI
ncbi:DJ-1 family glyoxalase III [uncultured Helicobacter sp.]|uniref:DJ-1 family glyoxalase III n=1 Tax=uncultured Helicobacter sp. TaxID=175537 RepID=UPI0027DDED97|nr:DJ-1 family glyoxalase III [uncultured Helicobacter sp.]